MTSQIDTSPNEMWDDLQRKKIMSSQNISHPKSVKRLKSPKKSDKECKKSTIGDMKIEDVFLNSEYFKHQSGNMSSLSFCSGDNGENRWTINSKFEIPFRPKNLKGSQYSYDGIKSDTAFQLADRDSKHCPAKMKRHNFLEKEIPEEKTEKFLEGILSDGGKLDRGLVSLITEQMFLAERELQITRNHLIETISKLNERDLEIIQLHDKIKSLQKSRKNEPKSNDQNGSFTKSAEDYQRLVTASEKLKKQVKDMEEFLNDYGLVWVGDREMTIKPDFDKILKSFERLNSVASQPKIIQTTLGAKFELPREIPIVLYSNGLLLRNTDFREYGKMSTAMFLQDVEDGYFPSELQAQFPDGVPFEVIDKRTEIYTPVARKQYFSGQGNRLGSSFEGKPPSLVYLSPLKQSKAAESIPMSYTDCSEKSPKKLHKKRSRNTPTISESTHFSAQYIDAITEKPCPYPDCSSIPDRTITVKVRFGKEETESFVLEVKPNQKMQYFHSRLQRKLCELYHEQCIVEKGANNKSTDFEIHVYGSSPFRLLEHLHHYPEECGIIENCVINVIEI